MTKIMIEQNLHGGWVELIEVETKGSPTPEEVTATIDALAKKFADNEVVFLIDEDGYAIVITTVNGPIKITPIKET